MRGRWRAQEGHVVALTAMSLPALIGMMALMLDGALLFKARLELQDAADAAALAGAMQIDYDKLVSPNKIYIGHTTSPEAGTISAEEAAQAVCAEYGVTCQAEQDGPREARRFRVVAIRTVPTTLAHLLTAEPQLELEAMAVALQIGRF
jgi:uncharacterized membrane protein